MPLEGPANCPSFPLLGNNVEVFCSFLIMQFLVHRVFGLNAGQWYTNTLPRCSVVSGGLRYEAQGWRQSQRGSMSAPQAGAVITSIAAWMLYASFSRWKWCTKWVFLARAAEEGTGNPKRDLSRCKSVSKSLRSLSREQMWLSTKSYIWCARLTFSSAILSTCTGQDMRWKFRNLLAAQTIELSSNASQEQMRNWVHGVIVWNC